MNEPTNAASNTPCNRPLIGMIIFGSILALCLVLSFSFLENLDELWRWQRDGGYSSVFEKISANASLLSCALMPLFIWFIYKTWMRWEKKQGWIVAVSVIISACMVVGFSAVKTRTLHTLYETGFNVFFSLMAFVSLAFLAFLILRPIFYNAVLKDSECISKPIKWDFSRYLIIFAIFIAAWFVWAIPYFPGWSFTDFSNQVNMMNGMNSRLSNHHPLGSTFLLAGFYNLWYELANYQVARFLTLILQNVMLGSALTFEIYLLVKLRIPKSLIITAIVFFAAFPYFGYFVAMFSKDLIFAALFTVYVTLFILYTKNPSEFSASWKWMLGLCASAFFMCMFRNNGFYIVLFSLPFLLFFGGKGNWVKRIAPFVATIILIPLTAQLLIVASGAQSGSVREMLSIPFQQTARYALDYPNEIEDWENDAIGSVLGYTPEYIKGNYKPYLSDNIKNSYKEDGSLNGYFSAWFAQGIRHPLSYADAFVEQTYGYWTVGLGLHESEGLHASYQSIRFADGFYDDFFSDDPNLALNYIMPDGLRHLIFDAMYVIIDLPFIRFVSDGGFYTWMILILAAYAMFTRNPRYIVLLLPFFWLMLTTILGPVNNEQRYFFGAMCAFPALLTAFFAPKTT